MAICRRRPTQAARRAIVWSALAFLGVQLGGSWALELAPFPVYDRPFKAKFDHLLTLRATAPDRKLVLMLGSSRTLVGLRAGRITQNKGGQELLVFNFGLASGGPMTEFLALRRLLNAQMKPDFLFLEILPLFFNQPREHTFEERYLNGGRLTISELAWLSAYHVEPRRLLFQWCKSRGLPWSSHRTAFWEQFAPALAVRGPDADTAMDEFGWNHFFVAEVTPEYRQRFTANAVNQYSHFLGDFHLSATAAQAMDDLLALCRREQIPVALVLMPEASHFRAMYSPTPRAGLDAFIGDLSRRWNVPIVDTRAWLEDAGFWDGHHLIPSAADAFTDRFGRETASLLN